MQLSKYIINKAGAKIYKDINRHQLLDIPVLQNKDETGSIYEVLSVGSLGINSDPVITIKESDGSVVAYRLPDDLTDWVDYQKRLSLQGIKVFPAKIELGNLNNNFYMEVL